MSYQSRTQWQQPIPLSSEQKASIIKQDEDLEKFKDRLATALAAAPPVRRRIIKKKLLKRKIGITELEAFIVEQENKINSDTAA